MKKMKTKTLLTALAIVSTVIFAGCKKDDFVGKVGVCPIVVSTVPVDGAVNVPVNQVITVTFNENMTPATITQNSFSLQGPSTVAGTIVYDGNGPTFSFTPTSPLLHSTTYTGKVATSVKDKTGNALQKEYVWSFTTIGQFTVALSSNPSAGGTTTGGGTFDSGSSVNIGATANSGYTFANWTEGGIVVSSDANYRFTLTGNRTLVANFTENIKVYTISLSSNPPTGGTTTGSGSYNAGTSVTAGAVSNAGYSFTNWTEGGTVVSTDANYSFTISASRTLVANFTENIKVYSVALSSNPLTGGTTTGGGSYNAGTTVTVGAVSNAGYIFKNWTEGGAVVSTTANYSFTISASRTLVANFTENIKVYSVTLSSNPLIGGTTTGSGSFNEGASVTVEATASAGYQFVNWTEGTSIVSSDAAYTFTISSNRTLVANFRLNVYTIVLASNPPAGGTTTGSGSYNSGSSVTVAASANTGYTFKNWTEGTTVLSTNASYTFTISGNRNLTANFTANSYLIELSSTPSNGGSTAGGGSYTFGTSVTVSATANPGFYFTGWTEGYDVVSEGASYTFTITGHRKLIANFRPTIVTNTLTLSSNPPEGGTTSGGGSFISGTLVTVSATANSGFTFTNWTDGGAIVSTDSTYTFTITGNRNLTANFTKITAVFCVTLSSNMSFAGTITGARSYPAGSTATVVAVPNPGFSFLSWTENGKAVSTSLTYSFTLTANRILVANFQSTTGLKTVLLSASPPAGGIVTGEGAFSMDSRVTVVATANAGYSFKNWTDRGDIVSTDASYSFIVINDRILIANFLKN